MNKPSDNTIVEQLRMLVDERMRGATPDFIDLPTTLPWLSLLRRTAPTPVGRGILSPSICLLVQGEKEMLVGQQVLHYGPGSYLQTGVTMPVSGQVTRASKEAPYYGIRIELDPREIAALVLEMCSKPSSTRADPPAISVERADHAMLEVVVRLLRMLDRPQDVRVLGRLIKQELIYHLLCAPGGATLSAGLAGRQRERAVGEAINWIRTHYNQPLSIDSLARAVHMSPSVFHRRFKAATVMSPLQYQKQIRLLEARKMLMSGAAEAASVAYEVGYESPSQFSREYRRLFGAPPLKDVEMFRLQPALAEP